MKTVRLRPGKERSALRRHPWIFEGSVAGGKADSGETVRVEDSSGRFLAWAAYSPLSSIRLRAWSFDESERIDAAFLERRIVAAVEARARWPIASNGVRLVHGEADGLPGLIVDRYADLLSAQFLSACVRGKLNMLISGGTGTGKTTTLNALSAFVPGDERIVTIEDAAELQLQQDHVITLESRPPNIEGKGEVRIRELVRNALRMRPDRIIVGEVRGAETLDMLQAMNTGHEGSLTTIHANSPRDALSRLETLVLTAGVDLPLRAIREQISSAFDLLVQIQRLVDGSRRITHVTEVLRMESDVITLQDIFAAKPPDEEHNPSGGHSRLLSPLQATGLKPHFLEKLAANGVVLPPSFFGLEEMGEAPRAAFSATSFEGAFE